MGINLNAIIKMIEDVRLKIDVLSKEEENFHNKETLDKLKQRENLLCNFVCNSRGHILGETKDVVGRREIVIYGGIYRQYEQFVKECSYCGEQISLVDIRDIDIIKIKNDNHNHEKTL